MQLLNVTGWVSGQEVQLDIMTFAESEFNKHL